MLHAPTEWKYDWEINAPDVPLRGPRSTRAPPWCKVRTLTFQTNLLSPASLSLCGSHQRISHSLSSASLAMKMEENHAMDILQTHACMAGHGVGGLTGWLADAAAARLACLACLLLLGGFACAFDLPSERRVYPMHCPCSQARPHHEPDPSAVDTRPF